MRSFEVSFYFAMAAAAVSATPQPMHEASKAAAPPIGASASSTAAAVTASYRYDSLGRLIQDAYPANTLSYTYDNAGNRTQAGTQ